MRGNRKRDENRQHQTGLQHNNYAKQEVCAKLTMVEDHNGSTLQSKEPLIQKWTQYCRYLSIDRERVDEVVKALESIVPPVNEDAKDILYSEAEEAIRSLKRHKTPNADRITAEMFQAGGENLVRQLHELCNNVCQEEKMSEEWARYVLVPIPKKAVSAISTELKM